MAKSQVEKIGCWLILIGALNWGLIGVGDLVQKDLNVVHMLLSGMPQIESIAYILVGVAAVWKLVKCGGSCK